MKNKTKYPPIVERCAILAGALLASFMAASICVAQNPPQLQITSPADGSVVNPGQSISVTLTSPANVAFTAVGVGGWPTFTSTRLRLPHPSRFSKGGYHGRWYQGLGAR